MSCGSANHRTSLKLNFIKVILGYMEGMVGSCVPTCSHSPSVPVNEDNLGRCLGFCLPSIVIRGGHSVGPGRFGPVQSRAEPSAVKP